MTTRTLPNVNAALFDPSGEATPLLRGTLQGVPDGPLLDADRRANPVFRGYLSGVATAPLPGNAEPLANENGTATRTFTLLMMGLP